MSFFFVFEEGVEEGGGMGWVGGWRWDGLILGFRSELG